MRKFLWMLVCILLLSTKAIYAQTKDVTGKVTDAQGAPVPGATIKVKGTKKGTSAGVDGTFKINLSGFETGQINGLSVISLGDFDFGTQRNFCGRPVQFYYCPCTGKFRIE